MKKEGARTREKIRERAKDGDGEERKTDAERRDSANRKKLSSAP